MHTRAPPSQVRGYESYMLLAASVSFSTHLDELLELVRCTTAPRLSLPLLLLPILFLLALFFPFLSRSSQLFRPHFVAPGRPDSAHMPCKAWRAVSCRGRRSKLPLASAPSVRNRLNHLLQFAVRGMAANRTATAQPLAAWVRDTLLEGARLEEQARARARATVGAAHGAEPDRSTRNRVAAVGSVIQGTPAPVQALPHSGRNLAPQSACDHHPGNHPIRPGSSRS